MTDAILSSLWNIFSCSFSVWNPSVNFVQCAFLICIVLGFILLIKRFLFSFS